MRVEDLEKYGVLKSVVKKLFDLGYQELTEVQRVAVETGIFDGKNILASAPTNTGKTFIGELAALVASIRKSARRSFFLVPLKAIADEKYEDFVNKYSDFGLKVAISTRDRTEFDDDLLSYDLIIATYEKLNALIIRRPKIIQDIGLVVVDEIQNISDVSRGTTLEVLTTRLISSPNQPQIIGLSATIPNAKDVAGWLNAILVQTTKRDIELHEGILYTGSNEVSMNGHSLNDGDFIYREFNSGNVKLESGLKLNTLDKIAEVSKNEQILVFTQTQPAAERTARTIAGGLPAVSNTVKLIEELDSRVESTPSTRTLKETLLNGVAFHHAGLLPEERRIIEDGFREGVIRVICSTTTLGAGVNTPAKTVVILSHQTYDGRNISTRDYKNMAGRAGRIRTKDNFGRSILLAENEKELQMLWKEYVTAQPEVVQSKLASGNRLPSSIIGLVASNFCNTKDDLINFIKMSLFGYVNYQKSAEDFHKQFDKMIDTQIIELQKLGLIDIRSDKIIATELGRRCAEELLSPSSVVLFSTIMKNNEGKIKTKYKEIVNGIIHLACCGDDAQSALLFSPKPAEEEELQAFWQVNPGLFLFEPTERDLFIKSLRTSRMLMRWIDGVPFNELRIYGPHGIIKRNAETISWILKGLARVIEKPVLDLGEQFQQFLLDLADRVFYGVPTEAVEIMKLKIPAVHRNRAIALAQAGFTTLDDLINASILDLEKVNGIGDKLAIRIKKHVENYIDNEIQRSLQSQLRRVKELGRDGSLIERLYKEKDDSFTKVCIEIFKTVGLNAVFIGDAGLHKVDVLITTDEGNIVLEGRRKQKGSVSAIEAEEVLGKGAPHNPIAHVTLGYPYFSGEAIKNTVNTKITLLKASVVGEILVNFWAGNISKDEIISILKSGKYVTDIFKYQKPLEIR